MYGWQKNPKGKVRDKTIFIYIYVCIEYKRLWTETIYINWRTDLRELIDCTAAKLSVITDHSQFIKYIFSTCCVAFNWLWWLWNNKNKITFKFQRKNNLKISKQRKYYLKISRQTWVIEICENCKIMSNEPKTLNRTRG